VTAAVAVPKQSATADHDPRASSERAPTARRAGTATGKLLTL
jgi:hypothetical protein